mmetsp:Transcript_18237/g.47621  ORF Transcript_18237/g.47621 Transcript_18237/m.47621 type:complete len:218 (+) Transcript_18237:826-1479(+)
MKHSHTHYTTSKTKVCEMIWVCETRVWVDLEDVRSGGRVLEQSVRRIEDLMRQEIKPLALQTAVVQSTFAKKGDVGSLLQVCRRQLHHRGERRVQNVTSRNKNILLSGSRPRAPHLLQRGLELFQFGLKVWCHLVRSSCSGRCTLFLLCALSSDGVYPRCALLGVVNVKFSAVDVMTLVPPVWKWHLIRLNAIPNHGRKPRLHLLPHLPSVEGRVRR